MDRTINYQITEEADGLRIEQFLRHQGYSYQNITQLKKMPESILKNGVWEYMRSLLATGDILTVHIQENESSPNIPPVELPLSIIYEDEDILVVNKPAGMPIHPLLPLTSTPNGVSVAACMTMAPSRNQKLIFR